MNLSIRLLALADYVPAGSICADVGTDHAHLPVWLVQQGRCPKALAMDVGKGPLSHAASYIKSCGLEDRIGLRLSDGVRALAPGEAQTVVIAGMGGPLIRRIMAEGQHMWDSVEHWIISPQSEQGQTRRWLSENGFAIARENMVFDGGKYYNILDVARGSMHYAEETGFTYGALLIDAKHPVLIKYLEEQERKLGILKRNLEETLDKQESSGGRAAYEETVKKLAEIRKVLGQMQSTEPADDDQ